MRQLAREPAVGSRSCGRALDILVNFPAFNQTESVPDFVAEVATVFTQFVVKQNVVAGRCGLHQAHTDTVGAVGLNELDRVGRVAERFTHLAAKLVAHNTCEVNVVERLLADVLVAGHNHAGNPEENNVGAGNQRSGWIVIFDFLVTGVIDAIEKGDGPEP